MLIIASWFDGTGVFCNRCMLDVDSVRAVDGRVQGVPLAPGPKFLGGPEF